MGGEDSRQGSKSGGQGMASVTPPVNASASGPWVSGLNTDYLVPSGPLGQLAYAYYLLTEFGSSPAFDHMTC